MKMKNIDANVSATCGSKVYVEMWVGTAEAVKYTIKRFVYKYFKERKRNGIEVGGVGKQQTLQRLWRFRYWQLGTTDMVLGSSVGSI